MSKECIKNLGNGGQKEVVITGLLNTFDSLNHNLHLT